MANGVFAGAEIALVALRPTRLKELADEGHGSARAALALKNDPERFLATVQVGITVVSAAAAAFGGASTAARLEPLFASLPALAPYARQISLALVIALVSYLSIVIGELVPKSIALRGTERYARLVARPLFALSWFARPLVWLLTQSSNLLLRPFGDRTNFTEARYSAAEIQQLVEEATKSGSLHPHAAEIATRALDFHELTAAEVMVPRRDVVMLQHEASAEEIRSIVMARPHTRLPVQDGGPDNVVGYVHIKDLAADTWRHGTIHLGEIMRQPAFVPDSKPAADLLREMQEQRMPLAIVIDAQGGVSGIVTIEDLVEELVGEIINEHAREQAGVVEEPAGTAIVPGTMPIRDLNRVLELDLPEDGDWNTIAGLVIHVAGRIPATGDKLELPDGTVAEVTDASPRRVRSVRVHRRAAEPEPDGAS